MIFIIIVLCVIVVFGVVLIIIASDKKNPVYDVVYKPISEKYYPRCNGYYLFLWNIGKWTLEYEPAGCQYSYSLDGAKAIIEKYKESMGLHDQVIKLD